MSSCGWSCFESGPTEMITSSESISSNASRQGSGSSFPSFTNVREPWCEACRFCAFSTFDAGFVLAPFVVADDALPARLVRVAGQHHRVPRVRELQDDAVLVHDLFHLLLVQILLGVDVPGRREAADGDLAVLAEGLPHRAAAL